MKHATMLNPARMVTIGSKILFDDSVAAKIVFANEPTTPASVPPSAVVRMQAPVTLVGGEQAFCDQLHADAKIFGDMIHFKDCSYTLSKIRGGNWGEVIHIAV